MRRMEKITGRSDDMLIIRGVNVFPTQIEELILKEAELVPHYQLEITRPKNLDEMAVLVERSPAVGGADERAGEAVKVFVVRKDAALTEADLVEYCKQQLTGYKKPKYVEFRDDLPKSNVGKILRRELRDLKPQAKSA